MKYFVAVCLMSVMLAGGLVAQDTIGEPDIDTFVFVDEEPKPLNMAEVQEQIGYPEAAVDSNIQGQVIMRVLVNEAGEYVKHKVVKDVHPLLANAVDAHVQKLNFSPAIREGNPIKFWVNIPFNFRMVEKDAETIRKEQIAELNKQIAEDPANFQALLTRGIAYRELNQLENAIADFDESLAVNPRDNKKKKSTMSYVFFSHFARGTTYSLKEDWAKASADFDAALAAADEMKVKDSLVTASLGKVYLERGFARFQNEEYDAADADYGEVIRLDPDQACDVYSLRSELNLKRENYVGVVEAMNQLVKCQPDDQYLHYSRGYYKAKMDDHTGAIEDFMYTVDNNPNPLFRIAALNQAAWSYMKMGKMDEAYATIDRSMQLNVLNAQTYYYRSLIHEGAEKANEACTDMKKAIDFGLEGEELEKAEAFVSGNCGGDGE